MSETALPPARPAPVPPARSVFRSPGFKFLVTGILTVVLAVPLFMVWMLKDEREMRALEVRGDIARDWGGSQTIIGPMLAVPFTIRETSGAGSSEQVRTVSRTALFLPDGYSAKAVADTDIRRVAIFDVPAYVTDITLQASFGTLDQTVFGPNLQSIDWSGARLVVSVGDLTGLETASISFDGATLPIGPNDRLSTSVAATLEGVLPASARSAGASSAIASGFKATASFRLKGTDRLAVAPIGRDSEIALSGDWPHPGFQVGALPSEREVRADGFAAVWRIPYLARGFPQAWIFEDDPSRLSNLAVGVDFKDPVDFYALVERALKYGLMFISAVFGVVFVLEVLSPRGIHPVQYLLVGLIQIFFYVLLLALAEHIGFGIAYAIASIATIGVISVFIGLALESRRRALAAALSLGTVFAVLYAILRLEDAALLAGAAVGFVALSAALFATRRVDWSGRGAPSV
ncbi:cell envelope integrity protein CreD [Chthonobacter albigriseus]|uniref:cell envelope integrity protein CreD n=1 Tax=Chthonobacter albigriseus TaxID=1683161 RepID=UPI0015EEDAEA|nr:cell envelope integrity protein CreD [Chthonobacter albigriseus]